MSSTISGFLANDQLVHNFQGNFTKGIANWSHLLKSITNFQLMFLKMLLVLITSKNLRQVNFKLYKSLKLMMESQMRHRTSLGKESKPGRFILNFQARICSQGRLRNTNSLPFSNRRYTKKQGHAAIGCNASNLARSNLISTDNVIFTTIFPQGMFHRDLICCFSWKTIL
jgi:hypothetical protein